MEKTKEERQKNIEKGLINSLYRAHKLFCKEEECEKCDEFKGLLEKYQ